MELTHEFTVPASRAETWAAFEDIASVAQCFPGASVEEATGETFSGQVKVKLGPVQLVYKGSGDFVEKDESSGTMRISAKGKDKRGNGTAGAEVLAQFTEADDGATRVTVQTDLHITGKPAQFGRGVIEDVSNKLLRQFVDCLAQRVGQPADAPAAPGAPSGSGGASPGGEAALPGSVNGADPAAGPATASAGAADARAGSDVQDQLAARRGGGSHRAEEDALDLGATVLPVLLRAYGKQAGAALGVLLVLWWLVRRRR